MSQDEFDFQYEQDSITIVFNTQMRDKNVMFDEITSCPNLQCALTDLHVSEPGSNSNGRNIHFKVDTGACGNLLPVNLYKQIAGSKAKANFLHSTTDHSVNLMAYNNKQIKQLGTCVLYVSCGANTRMVKLFVVNSRLNPIIGLNDSHKLKLVNLNCPIHQSWTGNSSANMRSFDSISEKSSILEKNQHIPEKNAIPSTLTKQWIVNNLKYKHLFKGIGKFNVPPVSITLKDNAQPVQKPPHKVPLVMRWPFKEELDHMENAGIISKYDSISGPTPEWLNSLLQFKSQMDHFKSV